MAHFDTLKQLLAQLASPKDDKVQLLQAILKEWKFRFSIEMKEVLRENLLFSVLAKVMQDNYESWKTNFPEWIDLLMLNSFQYAKEEDLFFNYQIQEMVRVFTKYLLNGCWDSNFSNITPQVCNVLNNCASGGCEPWQRKILEDKPFILELLKVIDELDGVWILLTTISVHPDAKVLLPKEVITAASKSSNVDAPSVFALLCTDADLSLYTLDIKWISETCQALSTLLTTGRAVRFNTIKTLSSLLLPLVNLSVAEVYKDVLGKQVIKSFLSIITDPLPDVVYIKKHLIRGRQEASRAIWNLAYHESNCSLITEANAIEKLKRVMAETQDLILKKNIAGILYMCNEYGPSLASIK